MLKLGVDYEYLDSYRDGWRRESVLIKPVPIWLPDGIGGWKKHWLDAGFITDWGSVPKFANDYFGIKPREGSISYLNHDACYQSALIPRIEADNLMWSNLKYDGVPKLERAINYSAVRLRGARAYGYGISKENIDNV